MKLRHQRFALSNMVTHDVAWLHAQTENDILVIVSMVIGKPFTMKDFDDGTNWYYGKMVSKKHKLTLLYEPEDY